MIFLESMRFTMAMMLLALLSVAAQEPGGTGSLEGRVVDAISGAPIAGATVIAGGIPFKLERRTETGADGTFRVEGLPAGSYFLVAYSKNYPPFSVNPAATLVASEQKFGIVFALRPFGSIRGRVLDDSGEPVAHVTVQALLERHDAGTRRLLVAKSADTDVDGQYKLDGLVGGKYYIVAQRPWGWKDGSTLTACSLEVTFQWCRAQAKPANCHF